MDCVLRIMSSLLIHDEVNNKVEKLFKDHIMADVIDAKTRWKLLDIIRYTKEIRQNGPKRLPCRPDQIKEQNNESL